MLFLLSVMQDKEARTSGREAITAKLVADLADNSSASRVLAMDLTTRSNPRIL